MIRIFFLAFALAGCSGDLPPATRVDKLRVLAVRAEPPEVAPGQPSRLDSLTVQPPPGGDAGAAQVSTLWLACLEPPGGVTVTACGVTPTGNGAPDGFGGPESVPSCADDPGAPLCLIGVDAAVTYAPPASALGGQVVLTMIAADEQAGGAVGCAMAAAANGGAPAVPDHCVIALKRLTVSDSASPNHNPALTAFTLDGAALAAGGRYTVGGAGVTLAASRAAGSAEPKADGSYEPLVVSWFATAGAIQDAHTSFQPADCDDACMKTDPPTYSATAWTAPTVEEAAQFAPTGEVDFWAVVRDDRGGVGWLAGRAVQ